MTASLGSREEQDVAASGERASARFKVRFRLSVFRPIEEELD